MQASDDNLSIYRFGDFVLNANTRVLSRDGATIPLTPRVLDTLLAFVGRPGETITKDELMSSIWPDSFVEEANLTQNVAVLRKALGENPRQHRFILTVPGKGYRFVPEVTVGDPPFESVSGIDPPHALAESLQYEPIRVARRKGFSMGLLVLGALVLAMAAATTTYLLTNREPAIQIPVVARTRQVTSFAGMDLYPAFSPNGNTLAFSSNRSGALEIYIRQMVQGASEIQLTSDGGHNVQAAFSIDGSHLAYHSILRGGVWIVPTSGGTPKRLTDFGSNPTWSPDGTKIAFQSDPLNDLGSGVRSAMPPSTIWTVDVDGTGSPSRLTDVGSPPGGHGSPEWSPDGRRIMFDTNDWASSNVWSVMVDGSGLVPVIPEGAIPIRDRWVAASDAVFAKDGRSIAFVADVGLSIQTVQIDSSGQAVGEATKIFDASAARVRHLATSPDGKRIAYSAISTSSNLLLTDLRGGASSEPKELTRSADARAVSPSFSPDGRMIAFQEYATGSMANIKVMDTSGQNTKQITSTMAFNPWWFPSGDRIGFSVPRGQKSEYWFASADGSVEKKLLEYDDIDVFNGRLSADGRSVLFNSKRSGTINIWQISLDGGGAKQLTFDTELAGFPAMSRDGKWIGMQIKRGGDTHVAYMPVEGGEVIQLTSEPGQSWVNDWSPDNDRIIYAGRRNSIWNIYSVSRTTREVKQLTNFDSMNTYVRYPVYSPVGDKIAYEYAQSTANIWMLELN